MGCEHLQHRLQQELARLWPVKNHRPGKEVLHVLGWMLSMGFVNLFNCYDHRHLMASDES